MRIAVCLYFLLIFSAFAQLKVKKGRRSTTRSSSQDSSSKSVQNTRFRRACALWELTNTGFKHHDENHWVNGLQSLKHLQKKTAKVENEEKCPNGQAPTLKHLKHEYFAKHKIPLDIDIMIEMSKSNAQLRKLYNEISKLVPTKTDLTDWRSVVTAWHAAIETEPEKPCMYAALSRLTREDDLSYSQFAQAVSRSANDKGMQKGHHHGHKESAHEDKIDGKGEVRSQVQITGDGLHYETKRVLPYEVVRRCKGCSDGVPKPLHTILKLVNAPDPNREPTRTLRMNVRQLHVSENARGEDSEKSRDQLDVVVDPEPSLALFGFRYSSLHPADVNHIHFLQFASTKVSLTVGEAEKARVLKGGAKLPHSGWMYDLSEDFWLPVDGSAAVPDKNLVIDKYFDSPFRPPQFRKIYKSSDTKRSWVEIVDALGRPSHLHLLDLPANATTTIHTERKIEVYFFKSTSLVGYGQGSVTFDCTPALASSFITSSSSPSESILPIESQPIPASMPAISASEVSSSSLASACPMSREHFMADTAHVEVRKGWIPARVGVPLTMMFPGYAYLMRPAKV